MSEQTHLNKKDKINLGSFYTPKFIVYEAYKLINTQIIDNSDFILLDTSCGYGSFLDRKGFKKIIGIDIDKEALEVAEKQLTADVTLIHKNSLNNISRKVFNISDDDKLIIVGNPPYNDRTSLIQRNFKEKEFIEIDKELMSRDVGISFLKSFAKFKADFVCVLHPLSYLIKRTNFKALKNFIDEYKLINSLIISSKEFGIKSKYYFPIIIALYKRDGGGMDFDYINNFTFNTIEGQKFKIKDFDYIAKYVDKYPNKKHINESDIKALFYEMRDINALGRSKTFMKKENSGTVFVTENKYSLYCYIDVFKKYIKYIPYYFGNFDIMINYKKFKELEEEFIKASENKITTEKIDEYFSTMLGVHYVK